MRHWGRTGRQASLGPAHSRKTVLGEGTALGSVGGTPRGHCSTVGPRAGDGKAVSSLPGWPLNPQSFSVLPFLGPTDKSQCWLEARDLQEISVTLGIFLNQLYRPVLWSRGWSNPDPCGGNTCVHKRGTLRTEPGKGLALCKRWL